MSGLKIARIGRSSLTITVLHRRSSSRISEILLFPSMTIRKQSWHGVYGPDSLDCRSVAPLVPCPDFRPNFPSGAAHIFRPEFCRAPVPRSAAQSATSPPLQYRSPSWPRHLTVYQEHRQGGTSRATSQRPPRRASWPASRHDRLGGRVATMLGVDLLKNKPLRQDDDPDITLLRPESSVSVIEYTGWHSAQGSSGRLCDRHRRATSTLQCKNQPQAGLTSYPLAFVLPTRDRIDHCPCCGFQPGLCARSCASRGGRLELQAVPHAVRHLISSQVGTKRPSATFCQGPGRSELGFRICFSGRRNESPSRAAF